MKTLAEQVLESLRFRFEALKGLGDKTLAQLTDDDVRWAPDPESNSIAITVRHLHGNMLSRWTDFLTSDGEKPWRDRDGEFVVAPDVALPEVKQWWEDGWACFNAALAALQPDDLEKEVTIRAEALTVLDALHRQLSHYGYHIGQIVWIARSRRGPAWKTLSIARNASRTYRPEGRD